MGAAPARDTAYLGLWREAWSLDEPSSPRHSAAPAPAAPRRRTQPKWSRRQAPAPLAVPSRPRDRRHASSKRDWANDRNRMRSEARPRAVARRRASRPVRHLLLPAVFLGAWLAVILVAPLALNVMGMQAEWRLAQLEQQHDDLGAERAQLKTQVAALSSAPRIREEADRLGLSLAPEVDYLILADSPGGEVVASLDPGSEHD